MAWPPKIGIFRRGSNTLGRGPSLPHPDILQKFADDAKEARRVHDKRQFMQVAVLQMLGTDGVPANINNVQIIGTRAEQLYEEIERRLL